MIDALFQVNVTCVWGFVMLQIYVRKQVRVKDLVRNCLHPRARRFLVSWLGLRPAIEADGEHLGFVR